MEFEPFQYWLHSINSENISNIIVLTFILVLSIALGVKFYKDYSLKP